MKQVWVLAAVLTAALPAWSVAATTEDAVQFRQGIFRALEWNLSDMGAMIQGRRPFDGARFALQAQRVEQLARMPLEGFVEASDSSAQPSSRARGEIWYQTEQFNRLMDALVENSAALAAAAQSQERDELRPLFGRVAQSCKQCHDRYRERD